MRTVLDNGMTVLLQENRDAKVVAVQLWVKVGSADEGPDEAGLAHLHEHMLFKGTEKTAPGEMAKAIEGFGGNVNAWTSYDQTVYHFVVGSPFFRPALDLLADAVTSSTFDPDELAREIEVVCEEIRRGEDIPARTVSRTLFALAFEQHPYRRPVIGSEQSVRSFTREKILAFYERHYAAGNMVLSAVGDFDESEALKAVQEAFATARHGSPPRPVTRLEEPAQRSTRARVVKAPVRESYLSLGWPAPGIGHPDVARLDLLAVLLGEGESSRLVQDVRRAQALVNDVSASAYTPKDPGLFIVGASLPGEKVEAALEAVLRHIAALRVHAVGEPELQRAKRLLEAQTIFQRETVQGQARKRGFFETTAGHVDAEERYFEAISACTPAQIRDVAHWYLSPHKLSIALVTDEGSALSAEELVAVAHRTLVILPPHPSPAMPPYQRLSAPNRAKRSTGLVRTVLPGGATLLVKPEGAVPLVSLRAAWKGGLRTEDETTNGATVLLARSLMRGTRTRDARQLAEEIDALAAVMGGSSGRNSFGARADFLSADLARGVGLFTELLLHPALDEAEVAKERDQLVEEIRSKFDSPAGAAVGLFLSKLYDRHPYRLDAAGTVESVSALTGKALREHLECRYLLGDLVIAAVGDVDPDEVERLVVAGLSSGRPGRAPLPEHPPEAALTGPREISIRVDRRQAHLVTGFRGTTLTSPDRHALNLLSTVLSGQGGRLFSELRDKRSLAYTVTALVGEGLDPGHFAVYIGTSPEKVPEAREGIRRELARVIESRIPDDELDRARRHILGSHEIGLQRLSARAAVLALDECYGLGAEHHLRHAEELMAVDAETVRDAAAKYLTLDTAVTALVSPDATGDC